MPNGYRMATECSQMQSKRFQHSYSALRDGFPHSWRDYQSFCKAVGTAMRLPNGCRMGTEWLPNDSSFRLKHNLMWKGTDQGALVKYNRFTLYPILVIPTQTKIPSLICECSTEHYRMGTKQLPNGYRMGSKWQLILITGASCPGPHSIQTPRILWI